MLPEGPGYLLFETIPRGEPPLAAHVKTEREWKRSEVEATTGRRMEPRNLSEPQGKAVESLLQF